MNTVIPADIIINPEIVKRVLFQQFSFVCHSLRLLGEGWDNSVYLVNETYVFRFPRRKIAVPTIEREIRVLPKLKKFLSLTIPEPTFIGRPSNEYPAPFYGHSMLEGISGCAVTLSPEEYRGAARALASFLKYLHNLDLDALDLHKKDREPEYNRLNFDLLLKNLHDRYERIKIKYRLDNYRSMIERICEKAALFEGKKTQPCLVHNDLYHRHLLFKDNVLTGIIDWGDCCVGDPVVDLGVVYQFFPEYTHDEFFSVYGTVKPSAKNWAKFLGLYYAIALLWFGDDRKDQNLIRTSLWTLHELKQNL